MKPSQMLDWIFKSFYRFSYDFFFYIMKMAIMPSLNCIWQFKDEKNLM